MIKKTTVTRYRRFKGFIPSNHRWILIILTVFAVVHLPHSVQAYDFQGCSDCHNETLDKDVTRKYLHSPFMENQCGECHVANASSSQPKKVTKRGLWAGRTAQQKINWLGDSGMADTGHGFLLPGGKLEDILVVEVHDTDGKISRQEIVLPLLTDLAEVEDNGKLPTITGLKVLEVKHGVFISATIAWQTDTLTNAMVRYGIKDLSKTSTPGKRFGRQHQVILSLLKPDTTYRFSVVSHDLFSRSRVSEPLTFSTSKPLTTQPDNSDNPPAGGGQGGIVSSFQRFGTDYFLELTLAQPASVFIGSVDRKGVPDDESHEGLSSEFMISTEACLSCHKAHLHPVNVSPTKPGIVIPPEFPTLPDGRITCISCHAPHGSDYYYFTRKPANSVLCVSCHQDIKTKRKNGR